MRGSRAAATLVLCLVLSGCTRAPEQEAAPPAPAGISAEEARELPPLAPAGVSVQQSDGRVTVSWCGTASRVSHYEVYRRAGPALAWQLIDRIPAGPTDTGRYQWVDPSPVAGSVYGVAALSPSGSRSEITSP